MYLKFVGFVFACLVLIVGYQNCAGEMMSSDGPLGENISFSSFNIFDLDANCIRRSIAKMIHVDDPIPAYDTSVGRDNGGVFQNNMFIAKKAPLGPGTGGDAPINLVIDDSIYDADPTNRAVGDRYKELIEEAITMWETGIGRDIFNIVEAPETVAYSQSISEDGYNTIYWNKNTDVIGQNSNTSAFACSRYSTDTFIESDIIINDFRPAGRAVFFFDCFVNCSVPNSPVQQLFSRNLESFRAGDGNKHGAIQFVGVMAHELGHVLGFKHFENDNQSVMNAAQDSYEVVTGISQGDIDRYKRLKNSVRHVGF